MGGGITIPPDTGEEDSSLAQDSSQLSSPLLRGELSMGAEDGAVDKDSRRGSVSGDCGRLRDWEANERMRENVYRKILQSGGLSRIQGKDLKEAKDKILSYTPGAWIGSAGAMKRRDYDVPKTTTLVLIGPKGSGKSSLINRISKVLEDDKFGSERAQVSYNSSVGDGTLFLQEYMMPRGSTSFCIYDTRSLSYDSDENIQMLKHWIEDGVRHGELSIRDSDSQSLKTTMKCKTHDNDHLSSAIRKVNYFIFAVNGLSVLKALESEEDAETQYTQMIASMFNCPLLAFKGELLGIPPTTQIFDIPECSDPVTESTTVDMLRYSLEHAEKNFTHKKKVSTTSLLPCMVMVLLMLIGTAINIWCMYHHAHIQQDPSAPSAIQHHQCLQHCSIPHAHIQHDHGPFPEEHNQKEPFPEEHNEKEPLREENIQQDPLRQEHILQDAQEQVQQDTLPLDQVRHDIFPQEHVQQVPSPQGQAQQDPLPQDHVQQDPLPQTAPSPRSVPSAHEDGSLPQENIQDGLLPRVQAELKKIKSKVEKFKTQLDWSKIRSFVFGCEDSEIHIDWKKIRHLYLDED